MKGGRRRGLDLNYLWVAVLALPAVLPLFQGGYLDSHDGLFHLYRLRALDEAFKAGVFYPRWFPDFAFGYGHPVLNYYSPLTYYVAQALHLLGPGYILSIKLTFAAGFLLSAWAMYLYASEVLGRYPALIAAVVYTYFPYHLADTYLRGALAEAFAFVFPPLCLWAMHRLFMRRAGRYAVLLALSYAGLVVSHNLTGLIFTPVLLGYLVFLWFRTRRHSAVPLAFGSFLIALALDAFYWLPVLTETRWVGLAANLASAGYERHLAPVAEFVSLVPLFQYLPDLGGGYDNPFYPLGVIYVLVILASVAVLCWLFLGSRRMGRRQVREEVEESAGVDGAWHLLFFLIVTLAALFMMLTCSLPVWRLAQPVLASLQYPWRFMALAALGLALLGGGPFLPFEGSTFGGVKWGSCLGHGLGPALLALLMIYGLFDLPAQPLPISDQEVTIARMWEEDFAARQIGATWTAEYVPVWVQADRSVVPLPPPGLVPFERQDLEEAEMPKIVLGEQGFLSSRMKVNSGQGFPLRFHTFYFPGWSAYLDGREARVYPSGDLALLTVDVPPGEHSVVVQFEDTLPRVAGNLVSMVTALGLIALALYRGGRRAVLLLVISTALLVAAVGCHIRPFEFTALPQRKEVNLEDQAKLVGYDLDAETYRPGDTIHVTLYWLALQEMSQNYKIFVHFMDQDLTRMWAQHDGDPVEGFTPTTRWLPGEIVADRHALSIPGDAPPGDYRLFAGMYEFETMRNLTILTPEEATPGNRIVLQDVEVLPR
jgi:hypothetical protein